jgi:hypothetical protein
MTGKFRITARVAALALCAFALGCGRDAVSPTSALAPSNAAHFSKGSDDSDPNFLSPAPDAPSIANPVIVFTATKGRDTVVRMIYNKGRTGRDSALFAQFRVPSQGLAYRPDGTAIAQGESVQITMTLVDATRGIIEFQPSGLRFSSKNPAVLKVSYEHANPDLNGDGVVNATDTQLRSQLHIICRESPTSQWFSIPSTNSLELNEVEAPILGFSGYAIDF